MAGAVVMGSGIASMHYTAMGAVSFYPDAMTYSSKATVRVTTLGLAGVVGTTGLLLLGSLVVAFLDRKKFHALQSSIDELTALSIQDGLTGVFNRRHFDGTLPIEWKRAARIKRPLALLLVDVDCFKMLNDRYGHVTGDKCLRAIADTLVEKIRRPGDFVARYGGEEFAVVLPGADAKGAFAIAEAMRHAVEELLLPNENSVVGRFVTLSIGVCSRLPSADGSEAEMVAAADAALYLAKAQGRNRARLAADLTPTAVPRDGVVA